MLVKRNRITYSTLAIIVMIFGLSARHFSTHLPNWINLYIGDTLWALMIFFLFGLLFRTRETRWITMLAFLFSFGIELSQLYQSHWINILRDTRIGGLVLGYGFLWTDLVSYSIGICVGIFVDKLIIIINKQQ